MLIYSAYPTAYRMIDEDRARTIQNIDEKYEKLKAKAKPEEIEKLEEAKKTAIHLTMPKEAGVMFYWSIGLLLSVPLMWRCSTRNPSMLTGTRRSPVLPRTRDQPRPRVNQPSQILSPLRWLF
jgi:hypothetical protein